MKRRDFLKDASLATLAVAGAVPLIGSGNAMAVGESTVAIAEGTNWAELLHEVLKPLGGIKAFVKSGQTVAIKPNVSFDRAPELAANTHPIIVKTMVQMVLDAGAKKVRVLDRTLSENRRCYVNSGVGPALETISDSRLDMSFVDDRKFVQVKIQNPGAFASWEFHKDALEADVFINLPIAKDHKLAKVTLGMKNMLGIVGGLREKIHWKLDQGLIDLNTVVKTHLTVIDATRILLRNGPSGGKIDDVAVRNTLIASADIAAADAVAAKKLFGFEPSAIGHIAEAGRRGIGQIDLTKIKVISA